MAAIQLPRYFTPPQTNPARALNLSQHIPSLVLDNLFVGCRHTREREFLVTMDAAGELAAFESNTQANLPEYLRNQLTHHEIAVGGKIRFLNAASFYLFDMQMLEQGSDAPGINDPVYLYGTIYGPFPSADGTYLASQGQLTVNRSDLLAGLVTNSPYAFHCLDGGTATGASTCNYNLTLPGDREEEIQAGSGIVLAYPLISSELMTQGVSNEALTIQLLYDILSALKQDLEHEKINTFLAKTIIPVPSRSLLEEDLRNQGYQIKGNTAVVNPFRNALTASGKPNFQGLLASTFGSLMQEKLELPEEGSLDELLSLARRALQSLPQWPPERTRLVMNKTEEAGHEMKLRAKSSPAPTLRPIITPKDLNSLSPSCQSRRDSEQDWMHDFINSHKGNAQSPPRITSSTQTSKTLPDRLSSVSKSSWMKDFEVNSTPPREEKQKPPPPASKKNADKPDWMNDFQ